MRKAFKLLISVFVLAAMPLMAVADDGSSFQIVVTKSMDGVFPEEVCWGDLYDVHIYGATGAIFEFCHEDINIAMNFTLWEEDTDFWDPDDNVIEEWTYFPRNGLTAGIPFDFTFENIHLAYWCDGVPLQAEFYIIVRGPCLNGDVTVGEENVDLIYLPSAPGLAAPANEAVIHSLPVTLQWNSIYNTDFYQVQLNDENSFDTPLVDEQTVNLAFEVSGLVDFSTYFWRIRSHNNICGDGNWSAVQEFTTDTTASDITDIQSHGLPKEFRLAQNHPNPFNPDTDIKFALPKACHVKLDIYNIACQKIRTLVDKKMTAGYRVVNWDGTNEEGDAVATGIYVYRMVAGDYQASKKMILLK